MLEKVLCIDNVGVLKKAVRTVSPLKKLSLVYADNARGKSTLSSVLLSCASGDAQDIAKRKTVGVSSEQKVLLRFTLPGGTAFNAECNGADWSGGKPALHVFNQAFVERNVFASTGVLPEHREALLTLALGDAAVEERKRFEQQAILQKECANKVSAAEGALAGYRGTLTVDQFIGLAPNADVEAQLVAVEKEISEARSTDKIANRPLFRSGPSPWLSLNEVREVLGSSFSSVAAQAEETVKAHLAKHNGSSTERWIAEGLQHKPDDECPFCGQATAELALLNAYKAYFDKAYTRHLERIDSLRENVVEMCSERRVSMLEDTEQWNQNVWQLWSESLELQPLPVLDFAAAKANLASIGQKVLALIEQKALNPFIPLDVEPLEVIDTQLEKLSLDVKAYGDAVERLNLEVLEYKKKLAKPDLTSLEARRKLLMVQQTRFEEDATTLVEAVKVARQNYKTAEAEKDAARVALDALMASTLAKFQTAINSWLAKFAAPFQIDQLAPTYAGGGVRSEYVLRVRGATVSVGPGSKGDLVFNAALSEGDKRTLAFAFFLARLFEDSNRGASVVVLDDVFTSLDKHRRHNTLEAVLKMLAECSQVIALAHDAHFLRELKKRAMKKGLAEVAELSLTRDADDYSFLDPTFDLDDYCSTDYYKHYVLVERYVAAEPGCDRLEVAKALRLLVEGHLHRCFPKKFKEGQTVGVMLDDIKNAPATSALVKLKPLHADLNSFNDFAAAFHHETSGGYPRTEVNDAELLPFARGALGFIQARSFQG